MLVREVTFNKRQKRSEEEKKKSQDLIEKIRKEHSKPVKGVFRFIESSGGTLEFPFRELPGEPIQIWALKDGETYTIPLGLAKHINNNMKRPKRDYMRNAKGEKMLTTAINGWTQRAEFVSTDLM